MKYFGDCKSNIHSRSLVERANALNSGDTDDLQLALLDNHYLIRELAQKKSSGKKIGVEDLQKIFLYENVRPTLDWFHEVRLNNSLTERETKEEIGTFLMIHLEKLGYYCNNLVIRVRDKHWIVLFEAVPRDYLLKNISISLTLSP